MTHNPSKVDRSESTQHKKPDRSGSFNQQRQLSGIVSSKGGVGASSASLNYSNRGVKKYNGNAPGVQSRPRSPNVNTGFSNSYTSHAVQNDAHKQQPANRVSDAPVTSSASNVHSMDATPQKINQVVPRPPSSYISVASPSSNPSTASSEPKAPTIPAKPPGDASRSFPLQFGSISPGFLNGVQIPARTSSAPPNLDEQKKGQVQHQTLRTAVPGKPLSSIPIQLSTKKDAGTFDQSNVGESQPVSMSRRETQVSAAPPTSQTQKPSVLSVPGMPMQLPCHQPQVTVQFGGPNSQVQSPSMSGISLQLPMPMPLPLPLGNPSVQPPMFVSGLPSHPMQSQGMMHQGQVLNFPSQMGHQLPPQLGNMGMNMVSQFPLQQTVKYSSRKTVKITHPETHEELRLDGSPGLRSHANVQPQSQHIPSFPPNHLMNFYNAASFYFPAASSVPSNSTQVPSASQPPRFYNQVTITPSIDLHGDKELLKPTSSVSVEKTESLKPSMSHTDDLPWPPKEIGPSASSVLPESKPGPGTPLTSQLPSSSVDVEVNVVATSAVTFTGAGSFASKSTTLTEEASNGVVVTNPIQNEHKKSDNIGQQDQVSWQSTSHSNYPLQLSETEAVGAKSASSRTNIVSEPMKELFSITVGVPSEASNLSSEVAAEGNTSNTLRSLGTVYIKSRQLKPNSFGEKEDAEGIMLNTDQNSLDTLMKPLSLQSSEIYKVEDNSLQEVASIADGLLQQAKQKTEEPSGCCYDDTEVDDHVFESTITPHCEGVENSASANSLSTQDANIIISDMPLSMPENISTSPPTIDQEPSPILVASLKGSLTYENEDNDPNNYSIISPSPAITNEKILLDTIVQKSVVLRGTKKKKELYKKAEAAGTSSDMYMAYKGPEEKKETSMLAVDLENISSSRIKQTSVDVSNQSALLTEKPAQSIVEPDDWENAAEIPTPQLQTSNNEIQSYDRDADGSGIKRYSRDFLFKFAEQCTDLPEGFGIISDVADAFMVSNSRFSHEADPSPERNMDRPIGGSRFNRRGSDLGDKDWSKFPVPLVSGRGDTRVDDGYVGNIAGFRNSQGGSNGVLRNPRGQTSTHYSRGILSGPIQSPGPQGGLQRNNSDSDKWQRGASFQKGLIPHPQTPLQVMHKAEKKYEIGKVTDEEEAKQRQLKSILNRLTPQNFEKLFEQVKQVNIDNFVSLSGVISQIFDKALMEPTFCEMYANFCFHLAAGLPNLRVDNETFTFKILLLNKCQEEFERGEREEEEANKAEEDGENKSTAEKREEKRLQARRRMLGNIRLIGELYKKKMLTARIMHECINKLLGQYRTPDEENIESLCKLMSTIGEMIDQTKAKEHMDAYFDIMANLSNNMELSSRVRFMLKDVIDLRKDRWHQRRKVEGPKKIDEVHRDAAQERQAQASRLGCAPSMGSSVRWGPPVDSAAQTPSMPPSPNSKLSGIRAVPPQTRRYGSQDSRTEERHSVESRTISVPLSERPLGDEQPITLGPQGGLARGMAFTGQPSAPSIPLYEMPNPGDSRRVGLGLNEFNSMPDRYGPRGGFTPRYVPDIFAALSNNDQSLQPDEKVACGNGEIRYTDHGFDRSLPASPPARAASPISMQDVSSEIVWPEEHLSHKSMAAIKEFYSARDENEVALCIKDLNAPSFYPSMISIWVTDSFEKNDMERDLLTKLLISLVKRQDGIINKDQLIKGLESVLSVLEDAVNDAPRAAEFLSCILAQVILENIVGLSAIGRLIYEGGEEKGRLVEIGLAAEVLGGMLEIIKSVKGDSVLSEMLSSSNLQLENFRPLG